MSTIKNKGIQGENCVAQYLQQKGCRILARNFYCRYGEIDLIAAGQTYICFVEVKTRREHSLGEPRDAVTAAKQGRIVRTAALYLQQNPIELQPRFDVAEVIVRKGAKPLLRYLPAAFESGI